MTTRILVVDGYAPSRHDLALFLRSLGPEYDVVGEAETDDMAMVEVRALRPDIVLVDIDLPDRSGLMTARAICREPCGPEVIVITDRLSAEYREAALAVGAIDCVAKPALVETIPTILAGIAARRRHPGGNHSTPNPPTPLPFLP